MADGAFAQGRSREVPAYVLVVDDDESNRQCLVDVLDEEGIASIAVSNGLEALQHLRGSSPFPAVVLTDLRMPVLDGWDLIREIRTDPALVVIPVIAMTASPVLVRPAIPILAKPFGSRELLAVLRTAAPCLSVSRPS